MAEETMIEVLKNESAKPINERRSISSHTLTGHGVYDDEPFETCGNAYWWYQRAVYWKRQAHRSEGQQQTMDFEEKSKMVNSVIMLTAIDHAIVKNFLKPDGNGWIDKISAIKHVRTVTGAGLFDSKNYVDNLY